VLQKRGAIRIKLRQNKLLIPNKTDFLFGIKRTLRADDILQFKIGERGI
jgi:hypothetical protein